jgi:hypothetical protein
MPTDPFVPGTTDTQPRNEPNLAPGVTLPPARRWLPMRPGDLADGVQPRGPLFGSPGPNVGYALTLVRRRSGEFALAPHEHREDAEAVVAALAMRRAASFGRAPVIADVECAARLLGYLGTAEPALVEWRARAVDGAHHDYASRQALVDAVPLEVLRLAPAALRARVGEIQAQLASVAAA